MTIEIERRKKWDCEEMDVQAPFPDLKDGHVDHLLSYTY